MLKKIISGGQTGADHGALDLAIKLNVSHGGWILKGRKTESGPLPLKYKLKELDTPDHQTRTKHNVLDSHGTVILSRGPLTGGSLLTQSFAKVSGRPNCHIDLLNNDAFEAAIILQSFVLENQIEILNVAGPRASHDPEIYSDVRSILEAVFYLMFLDSKDEEKIGALVPEGTIKEDFPETKDQAISLIESELPLKTKIFIAKLENTRVQYLYFGWLDYLKRRLGFDSGNQALFTRLRNERDPLLFTIEDGVMEIVKSLKQRFKKNYTLRIVK